MVYARGHELLSVVVGLVQPDDEADVFPFKIRHVVLGRERLVAVVVRGPVPVVRSGEREELAFHQPVQVAVLDGLEVLVLREVEVVKVKEAVLARLVQPFETI